MLEQIAEITVQELAQSKTLGKQPLLLDVRHDWEVTAGALDEAVHVPLTGLVAHDAATLAALPSDKSTPIVTYCHHGVRSAKAASLLAAMGYTQVQSLAGGIDAWSCEIDATVARY